MPAKAEEEDIEVIVNKDARKVEVTEVKVGTIEAEQIEDPIQDLLAGALKEDRKEDQEVSLQVFLILQIKDENLREFPVKDDDQDQYRVIEAGAM